MANEAAVIKEIILSCEVKFHIKDIMKPAIRIVGKTRLRVNRVFQSCLTPVQTSSADRRMSRLHASLDSGGLHSYGFLIGSAGLHALLVIRGVWRPQDKGAVGLSSKVRSWRNS